MNSLKMSFSERAKTSSHPLTQRLLAFMDAKQTNLALSADVTSSKELLRYAEEIGPEICLLKTHIDILHDFDFSVVKRLRELADKHQFILFEDRKFADIGHTVSHQYQGGVYRIADWAELINAHPLPGPGIIEGLKKIGLLKNNGLLLIAQMSSKGNLMNSEYTQQCIAMAHAHKDFVIGFITQEKLLNDPGYIHMTPGIQIAEGKDQLGQQYVTPAMAIRDRGNDVIIVGRGILSAPNPVEAAKKYKQLGWEAFQSRLK
jgi:uridine monophosphate synthetase